VESCGIMVVYWLLWGLSLGLTPTSGVWASRSQKGVKEDCHL
jgi:hypothetical protein